MSSRASLRFSPSVTVRVVADAIMLNVALVAALAVRFLIDFAISRGMDMRAEFWTFVYAYLHNFLPLTAICLAVFAGFGIYTYGRAYRGRLKALVIAQALATSYLLFSLLTYTLWENWGWTTVPRGALILAAAFHLPLALGSRSWSFVWDKVIRPEREAKLPLGESVSNVLVIGGAGYIGSALLPKLVKQGYRVRVLDMFLYGKETIADVAEHPRVELIKGDFRQVDVVVSAVRGMDAVIHLGAIVGDPACDLDEDVTIGINLEATRMIAQVAKAQGIRRFVFASTCSVYGASDELLDESSTVEPISLYGHTKLAAEQGLLSMQDDRFTPTIVRFATIYGLSGRTRFDLVVNLLAAKAKMDGAITVHGGRQWRPFVHVDDAALAVFELLKAPLSLVGSEIFNVGSDAQNYTIEQVGELIRDHVPGSHVVLDASSTDQRNYRVSFKKISEAIGFTPQWTVEMGIEQVAEVVATGTVNDYQDACYSNVKYLTETGAIHMIRVDDDWSRYLRPPYAASASLEEQEEELSGASGILG